VTSSPPTRIRLPPNDVREPFAYDRPIIPLAPIVGDAGAKLLRMRWRGSIPLADRHTEAGERSHTSARAGPRRQAIPLYRNAITIDDRRLDETLHGLIQDIEGHITLAFVARDGSVAAAAV